MNFTVYTLQGETVQLSDYLGKPIILNFWASWCGPCRYEMPDFQEKYLQYGDQVQFLMVNLTHADSLSEVQALLAAEGYTFPVLLDLTADGADTYGIVSIPTTFFIDAEGYIIKQHIGAMSAAQLQEMINKLI